MGRETRALSGDPVLLLLLLPLHLLQPPPLRFLGRYAESLLAPVCVKGEKEEEKKNPKEDEAQCVFSRPPLGSVSLLAPKKKEKKEKGSPSAAV